MEWLKDFLGINRYQIEVGFPWGGFDVLPMRMSLHIARCVCAEMSAKEPRYRFAVVKAVRK